MPLKTLKIIERNRDSLIASPIKDKNVIQKEREEEILDCTSPVNRTVKFEEENIEFLQHLDTLKRANSLPGSPMPDTLLESQMFSKEHKTLRMAKSYDVGLNCKANKNKNWEFFKNKNRLSLSVFDEVDTDASDEETVISVSPPNISNYLFKTENQLTSKPLRRYNSHESILSVRNPVKTAPAHLIMRQTYPSIWQKRTIVTQPTTSFNNSGSTARPTIESPHLSKHMLSQFIKPPVKKSGGWFGASNSTSLTYSIFQKWFNSNSLVTKEVGNPNRSAISSGRPILQKQPHQSSSNNHSTSVVLGPNGSKFVRGLSDPLVTCTVSYSELQEALSTEFNF
ncbi:unnamed protein product [Kluyveromyces dobzhanskii CBS 2104]|uniref:WGS project CCBQ000000000 data, contig MAT n=1 Tax=Kluyveromyces dobzhanskii CBS 2104 TaxID=1427455 RepID=A0A0A8L3H7_9SACH|nr:unnamed protein product [Kluyveromyces dobzhanskii CBS 2104]